MRQRRPPHTGDVEMVEVTLTEDAPTDPFVDLLHQLAVEAAERRAHNPGDPRPEVRPDPAGLAAADAHGRRRRRHLRHPWA